MVTHNASRSARRSSPKSSSAADPASGEQRLDKRIRVERLEVVDGFADADELDGEVDGLPVRGEFFCGGGN